MPSRPHVPVPRILAGILLCGVAVAAGCLPFLQERGLGAVQLEPAFPKLHLEHPTDLAHAGDGSDRLFVSLQEGRVIVFQNRRSVAETHVFLDLEDKVYVDGSEDGLVGLTFDPAYRENGYLYVYYTAIRPRRVVLARYRVSETDYNVADPASELVILEVSKPYRNHNGGALRFGPDGYLYVSVGDGGASGDPHGHGQDLGTLLGSLLRIDVRAATAAEPYRVPPDNPFLGVQGARPEIWAYGFRNPFKLSFDHATGALLMGDVGQRSWEEVNLVGRGKNYGWNVMEGAHCFPPDSVCDPTPYSPPLHEYSHVDGCAVVGGGTYRGRTAPRLKGAYVFADYCRGKLWAFRHDGQSVTEHALLANVAFPVSTLGEDESGEMYALAYRPTDRGTVFRFRPAPRGVPTPTDQPAPLTGQPPTPSGEPPLEPLPPGGDG